MQTHSEWAMFIASRMASTREISRDASGAGFAVRFHVATPRRDGNTNSPWITLHLLKRKPWV